MMDIKLINSPQESHQLLKKALKTQFETYVMYKKGYETESTKHAFTFQMLHYETRYLGDLTRLLGVSNENLRRIVSIMDRSILHPGEQTEEDIEFYQAFMKELSDE